MNLKRFFKDSFKEIRKTSWPTKKQTFQYTLLVIIFCLIMALFLGFLDSGFGYILSNILK